MRAYTCTYTYTGLQGSSGAIGAVTIAMLTSGLGAALISLLLRLCVCMCVCARGGGGACSCVCARVFVYIYMHTHSVLNISSGAVS